MTTGAAELGFVALSQVINEPGGSRWLVPATYHAPIDAAGDPAQDRRRAIPPPRPSWTSSRARRRVAIIKRYGYEIR